ncbi:pseudaminic acid cytidylyltransferase [Alteromonas mediterranea]|uniref:pseudaminic acid cytidylyltransferase n=1 Tax=Alteromonas mediterranea TaxID=314275 RepID=UPI0011307E72|nr:pseudaminic acid cytidylyltransferase [Alteromonas mediterranea]QDG37686.1 pseudaminic acid cytidylyltransferase [Alteromonas mediterranea]
MNLAIIPARGGSKRIPQKNIRLFEGKPLIAYSIEVASQSNCFDKIIVSTDSEEIADVAREYGADVPFIRPAALADDFTGTTAVTRHAIRAMQELGFDYEYSCCIYATAPFLQERFLQQGLKALVDNKSKAFAFSATSFAFPIQRAISISEQGVEVMFPEHIKKRSQDLVEAYHDAGQFYWGRSEEYLKGNKSMFSHHSYPVILPRYLVQDIDTIEDWQRAELMYKAYVAQNLSERTNII